MFAKNLSPPLKSINIFIFNSKTKKSINEFVTKKNKEVILCVLNRHCYGQHHSS